MGCLVTWIDKSLGTILKEACAIIGVAAFSPLKVLLYITTS